MAQANWDDLRVFLSVARQQNLDSAAKQLHMDPTTLGRRLRRLEEATGATLFERSRRGHQLTPSGEELFARMEETEHHLLASVPCHRLKALHHTLLEKGAYEGYEHTIARGYWDVIKRAVPEFDSSRPAAA